MMFVLTLPKQRLMVQPMILGKKIYSTKAQGFTLVELLLVLLLIALLASIVTPVVTKGIHNNSFQYSGWHGSSTHIVKSLVQNNDKSEVFL